MSENGACLAITERKPQSQRPGGCVGIFFQLFDWNRRFAKKKLFSKKLLPPARAKKAAKNLGGDDKMPKAKLHLIGDERNGISGSESGRRNEMKAPSLVARLMGLESMPSSYREKPSKASMPESLEDDGNEGFVLGKEEMKLESRPQKLQKTGAFERQAVTRFGAEAFQIKNVLSRSRKHQQHPKLASPVKSPRASTGRNVSRTRLIDVATRILEPGLQATNRARCSLTYHPGSMSSLEDEAVVETRVRSPELFNDPGYNASEAKSLACQASCKNCGESLDDMNFRSCEEEQCAFPSSAPSFVQYQCEGSGWNEPRAPVSYLERENDAVIEKPVENSQDLAGTYREGKFVSKAGQERWSSPTKPWKSSNDENSTALKSKTQDQNRMSLGKERISLQSRRLSMAANVVSEPKDFVSLNRNISGRTRPRLPPKAGKSNVDNQRKTCEMVDDSLSKLRSPVRKRRSVNTNGHNNDRNLQSDAFTRREMRVNSQFTHQSRTRSMPYRQERSSRVANGNKDGAGSATTTSGKRRDQKGLIGTSTCHQRKLLLDGNNGESHFQEPCPLRGDALSALLEQKLKELTSQEEDELTTGTSHPKKSTAMILQELITALNAEKPVSNDFRMSGTNTPLQAKAMNGRTFTYLRDEDHFSPGSVLEASFSNDSCFSSSVDESSGLRMDFSQRHQQPLSEIDLLDSATSWSKGKACTDMVSDLVNHISQVLQTMNLTGLTETKITHAREVIFNTELLFGNAASLTDFLVGPFLLDELERFARSTQPHYALSLNLEKTKEGLLRGFLFDSMIECLDSNYGRSAGFKAWSRLPLQVDEEDLIGQVDEDVRRWTEMVGKAPDEIVEWEMSHGLGKWVDFDAEVFESGEEIDSYILEYLVEEIVLDL